MAAFFFVSRAAALTVGGMLLSGMSRIVVTPPAAAARVAVSNPSHSVRPGSLTCTCVSTRPGSRTSSAPSWTTVSPSRPGSSGSMAAIRPSRTPMQRATSPPAVMTRGARNTRSNPPIEPRVVIPVTGRNASCRAPRVQRAAARSSGRRPLPRRWLLRRRRTPCGVGAADSIEAVLRCGRRRVVAWPLLIGGLVLGVVGLANRGAVAVADEEPINGWAILGSNQFLT